MAFICSTSVGYPAGGFVDTITISGFIGATICFVLHLLRHIPQIFINYMFVSVNIYLPLYSSYNLATYYARLALRINISMCFIYEGLYSLILCSMHGFMIRTILQGYKFTRNNVTNKIWSKCWPKDVKLSENVHCYWFILQITTSLGYFDKKCHT